MINPYRHNNNFSTEHFGDSIQKMKYVTIKKDGEDLYESISMSSTLKEINLIEEFLKIDKSKLAKYINKVILSQIKTWKVKLTKIYLMDILSSYDLEGIDDEILKQQILIEAITKDDIIHHKDLLSEFEIADGVIYVPHEEKDSENSYIIRIPQDRKEGWHEEDFLAIYFAKGDNFYGYTCFELPQENNPIKDSLKQLSQFSKVISFMLDYYFFHNIAPYLDRQTNLYNKNYFNKLTSKMNFKHPQNYLVINIDINCLKEINDTYGHLAGDAVINYVAEKLRESVRQNEQIIRWGGDEFLVIVSEISVDHAAKLITRIEESLSENNSKLPYFKGISLGYALGEVSSQKDFEKLYNLSDEMMYKNKNNNHNAVYNINPNWKQ